MEREDEIQELKFRTAQPKGSLPQGSYNLESSLPAPSMSPLHCRTATSYLTTSFVLLSFHRIGHEKQSVAGTHALLSVYIN